MSSLKMIGTEVGRACFWLVWLSPVIGDYAAGQVPYPAALNGAAVSETSIAKMAQQGLVVGNGELNAVIYSTDADLRLRLAKNDCWDVRVDTKHDPPLPTIDVATGKVTGHGGVGSWKAPYPTALPCAELILSAQGKSAVTEATLDLAHAVARVQTTDDAAEVRVLAQSNVVLVHSGRPLSCLGPREFLKDKNLDQWVLPGETGRQGECTYLHQEIPGDEDVSGMDIYVVAGRKNDWQAIAVVTSRDCPQPLDDAVRLVSRTLADPDAIAKHAAVWQEFWSKSGIQLGDGELQNWWYRMLYFFRVFSRSDGNAVGLAACFDHLAGWHNSLKLNYNIQQTYFSAAPVNHPELLEPFIDVLRRGLPRGTWFAASSFPGAEGAFFHSDLWPFEPDPAQCTTPCKHQQTYLPWGYTWGMAGHTAVVVWDYYKFAPSAERLERVYPLIKGFGTFYCSLLEKCALQDGKRRMGPSYFPELGTFNQYNVCYDISYVTAALKIAREAALLKQDSGFLARIDAVIGQVPTYGVQSDPDQAGQTAIEPWAGARFDEGADRHGTLIQGIFPAGVINWFSGDEPKGLGIRTINRVEKSTNHANSNVMINIARARLGLGAEAIANAKMCFSGTTGKHSPEQLNGLFSWKGHGYFMTEQVGVARLVTELLLQSEGGVLRFFPAWPAEIDARFTNLLAEGGFEVSAEQVGGQISNVKIRSTMGGAVKLLAPWTSGVAVTEHVSKADVRVDTTSGISSFATSAGKTYLLKPAPFR